jgi:uncharacterized protein (DUF302 family)
VSDGQDATEDDVVTKLSEQSVPETVAKLIALISAKGMKVFAVIDQAAEARQVGLALRETTLVISGSPQAGTPVMAASPLSAARHGLAAELAANLSGIDALTTALVAA